MVDFEQEKNKIENWQSEQGWKIEDPFTHLTDAKLFVGFDDLLKKFYHFAVLGKNYGVVYGQYGYGKTALIKKLATEYAKKYNVVLFEDVADREYVAEKIKRLCSGKLLRTLTFRKIDSHDYTSFNRMIKKRTILIFDEAHSLDDSVFSYVRSLSESGTIFSIIFAGKPEIVVGEKRLPQYLIDRLELSEALRPLSEKEGIELIKKRIELLAKSDKYLLTEKAMKEVVNKSREVPREILENCSRIVEFAIQNNKHKIDEKDLKEFFKISREAAVPEYVPEITITKTKVKKRKTAPSVLTVKSERKAVKDVKTPTLEKMMEGSIPTHVPRHSYDVEREGLLRELSPLQKRVVLYLFEEEPKTAPEIAEGIDDKYDTVRHMLKRLQGKYNEPDSKPRIKDLYPLIEEKENPAGRGYIYSLSSQIRKILSID